MTDRITYDITVALEGFGCMDDFAQALEESGFKVEVYHPTLSTKNYVMKIRRMTKDEIAEKELLGE